MARQINWVDAQKAKPTENTVVETKIDDQYGVRNKSKNIYSDGRWLTHDGVMYIYYSPTHWRYLY